jgi:acetyl-CoA C-acetyltransferase
MTEAVIVSACRTAIGRFLGGLSPLKATDLGAIVVKEAINRAGIEPGMVDEVIMGNVISAGLGQNPARSAQLGGGVPPEKGALTINKVCGSGMKAAVLATQAIKLGDHEIIVAGGMESMSNGPYLLYKARTGYRLGDGKLVDTMIFDGLWDIHNDIHMGQTGEFVSEKYGIDREEQDKWAVRSHLKSAAATSEGRFSEEIVPVEVPQRKKEPLIIDKDEGIRADCSMEGLARLKPAFIKDGTVTAGNASQISDGASALVIMSDKKAEELGLKPLARILNYATGGREPKWVMLAPIDACRKVMELQGVGMDHYDLVELNEPFAVATIALMRELEVPEEILNVNGGAVALGHPIGCTGARLMTTLIYELKRCGKKNGLAGLCLGGGNAVAISIELM